MLNTPSTQLVVHHYGDNSWQKNGADYGTRQAEYTYSALPDDLRNIQLEPLIIGQRQTTANGLSHKKF